MSGAANIQPTALSVAGRRLEALDVPGDDGRAPLVLLHEGLGSVGLWRGLPELLAAATGRRVIAFSRFGHGRSEPPAAPRTEAFFHQEALEVLPAVLSTLHAERPLLVGHSDGGSIALIAGGVLPVTGIVVLAAHVFVEPLTVTEVKVSRLNLGYDAVGDSMIASAEALLARSVLLVVYVQPRLVLLIVKVYLRLPA